LLDDVIVTDSQMKIVKEQEIKSPKIEKKKKKKVVFHYLTKAT